MRLSPAKKKVIEAHVATGNAAAAATSRHSPPALNKEGKVADLLNAQSSRNVNIAADFSPSPIAQSPAAITQASNPSSFLYKHGGHRPAAQLVAAINAAASMDSASTLSGTEKGDAKSTWLLHNS